MPEQKTDNNDNHYTCSYMLCNLFKFFYRFFNTKLFSSIFINSHTNKLANVILQAPKYQIKKLDNTNCFFKKAE